MMKKLYFLFALLFFAGISFAQDRNFRTVKNPTDNPTNQQRKAMVIGMSDYGAGRSLSNTLNDADDMANVLTKLGFKVTLLKNNDYRNLKNNLRDWYNTIEGNDMAIFYFAGHGMEVKGENYLIPIDAELSSEADVEDYTLKVNNVLGNMEERRVGMKLIILDACRDNPFKRSWSRGSEYKGLAQMNAPKGTYIAFAASPGNTAQDGGNYGLRNGVFTHYLKQEILKEGASIEEIFNNVTDEVSNLTDERQTPFKNSSLRKTFYFIPPNNKPAPDRPAPDNNNASDLLRKANTFFANEQYYDAFPLYLQAANAGNAGAQIKMGACYANGFGVTKDHAQAVYWYRKAAEQNSDGAQYSLGVCYEKGLGVSKDKEQAIAWYKKAAKQGHSGAQDALERLQNTPAPEPVVSVAELKRQANTFYNNKQYNEAFPLYKKAAEQGDRDAQFLLGFLYKNAFGTPKDDNQAVYWYRKAAEQDEKSAQCNLGTIYYNGEGVTKDFEQAVYWYRKAADQGSVSAQNNLGICYEYGKGVSKDIDQAKIWYKKAADQGNEDAKKELEKLQNINPDGVVINGVRWATKNVGANNPEDYGNYYNWEEAQKVCPKGWRLPTKEEFESLINSGSVWTTQNGKDGRKFGEPNNFVFFSSAGFRMDRSAELRNADIRGYYWCGTPKETVSAYMMGLGSGDTKTSYSDRSVYHTVRCVSE